tara:strand:+ start:169 stop:372 length:204 start_codon:yes stop_codon:yes gene_type:complete
MSRKGMVTALRARFEADIAEADATINIYLNSSVGIGEHPQHLDEINKLLAKIAEAKDKLEALEDFDG